MRVKLLLLAWTLCCCCAPFTEANLLDSLLNPIRPCKGPNLRCDVKRDCCPDLYCSPDHICKVPGEGCSQLDTGCSCDKDCCGNMMCLSGKCTQACREKGDPCCEDKPCCDPYQCRQNICTRVDTGRCRDLGQRCCAQEPCCGSWVCRDGECAKCHDADTNSLKPTCGRHRRRHRRRRCRRGCRCRRCHRSHRYRSAKCSRCHKPKSSCGCTRNLASSTVSPMREGASPCNSEKDQLESAIRASLHEIQQETTKEMSLAEKVKFAVDKAMGGILDRLSELTTTSPAVSTTRCSQSCKPFGGECLSNSECCSGLHCTDFQRCDLVQVPCVMTGADCREDSDCCPNNVCNRNGSMFVCQSSLVQIQEPHSPMTTCQRHNDLCSSSTDCCIGRVCSTNGICKSTHTCGRPGEICNAQQPCCHAFKCGRSGICDNNDCSQAGEMCRVDEHCCSGLICNRDALVCVTMDTTQISTDQSQPAPGNSNSTA